MKRNKRLLNRVADAIEAHPERYLQADWVSESTCGTAFCVGGWAVHLHYRRKIYLGGYFVWQGSERWVMEEAAEVLGLDDNELFEPSWKPLGYDHTRTAKHNARKVARALRRLAEGATLEEVSG